MDFLCKLGLHKWVEVDRISITQNLCLQNFVCARCLKIRDEIGKYLNKKASNHILQQELEDYYRAVLRVDHNMEMTYGERQKEKNRPKKPPSGKGISDQSR